MQTDVGIIVDRWVLKIRFELLKMEPVILMISLCALK